MVSTLQQQLRTKSIFGVTYSAESDTSNTDGLSCVDRWTLVHVGKTSGTWSVTSVLPSWRQEVADTCPVSPIDPSNRAYPGHNRLGHTVEPPTNQPQSKANEPCKASLLHRACAPAPMPTTTPPRSTNEPRTLVWSTAGSVVEYMVCARSGNTSMQLCATHASSCSSDTDNGCTMC